LLTVYASVKMQNIRQCTAGIAITTITLSFLILHTKSIILQVSVIANRMQVTRVVHV